MFAYYQVYLIFTLIQAAVRAFLHLNHTTRPEPLVLTQCNATSMKGEDEYFAYWGHLGLVSEGFCFA